MPVEFGVQTKGCRTESPNSPPAPMRMAFDELSAAISTAYAAVDVLAGRLDPVLVTPNDGAEGGIRPSHSAPLLEEAHQLAERVHKLASTVREITDRLVL